MKFTFKQKFSQKPNTPKNYNGVLDAAQDDVNN